MKHNEFKVPEHLLEFEKYSIRDFAEMASSSILLSLDTIYELAMLIYNEDFYDLDVITVAIKLYEENYLDDWSFNTTKELYNTMKSIPQKYYCTTDANDNRKSLYFILLLSESYLENMNSIINEYKNVIFKTNIL